MKGLDQVQMCMTHGHAQEGGDCMRQQGAGQGEGQRGKIEIIVIA